MPDQERSRVVAGFAQMRLMVSGSAALPASVHQKWTELTGQKLLERYGMTEIGPGIMMPLEDAHMSGSGSVGIPTDYRKVKIVDEGGQEVSQGEIGELWITGPGMFKGYYNNAEATAEVFEGKWGILDIVFYISFK